MVMDGVFFFLSYSMELQLFGPEDTYLVGDLELGTVQSNKLLGSYSRRCASVM